MRVSRISVLVNDKSCVERSIQIPKHIDGKMIVLMTQTCRDRRIEARTTRNLSKVVCCPVTLVVVCVLPYVGRISSTMYCSIKWSARPDAVWSAYVMRRGPADDCRVVREFKTNV